MFIIIEQNRYRSITKEIGLKFLTCYQQIIQLNADMLSLHRRSQLETPLPIASPLPELHKVLNFKLVALQTAKIWSICVIYTHTHTYTDRGETKD